MGCSFSQEDNLNLGVFNFWINDLCYPAKGINITLSSVFNALISNVVEINALKNDLGNVAIEEIDFTAFESENLVWLDTGELFQFGFGLVLGFDGDFERLFYTVDYEKTYSEVILRKGVLIETLKSLIPYVNKME
ncbi:Imm42 family immunity protein [Acinetobacter proteolyticus]|nr:Imm42 family immunity protein [Acinetobacter proteolyticus]WEI18139.1 Imm42 family immunity protein [Acinetobacter proteolyticus]